MHFYGAYSACGVRVASVINSGITGAINKCSSKCFSVFYDNIAVRDLLCYELRILPTWGLCFNGGMAIAVR